MSLQDKIREAIRELETEFFFTDEEINTSRADALDMAIDSLKAWDSAIASLENFKLLYSPDSVQVHTIADCENLILVCLGAIHENTDK